MNNEIIESQIESSVPTNGWREYYETLTKECHVPSSSQKLDEQDAHPVFQGNYLDISTVKSDLKGNSAAVITTIYADVLSVSTNCFWHLTADTALVICARSIQIGENASLKIIVNKMSRFMIFGAEINGEIDVC